MASKEASNAPVNTEEFEEDTFPEGGAKAFRVLFGCCCAVLATFGISNSVGILQSYWSTHQLSHYPTETIAWIPGVNVFLILLLGIQIGPLFDRLGPRWILLGSSIVYVSSLFILGQCSRYWHFMVTYGIVAGSSSSCLVVVAMSVPAQWFKKKRGLAMGIVSASTCIGGITMPSLLTYTLANLPYTWSMRILGFIAVGLLMMANLFIVSRLNNTQQARMINLKWFLNPVFVLVTLGTALEYVLFSSLTFLPDYALLQGFSTSHGYHAVSILNAGSLLGRFLSGVAADKLGCFNVMLFNIASSAVVMFSLWVINDQSIVRLYFLALLFGFGSGSIIGLAGVCYGRLCKAKEFGECWGTGYSLVSIVVLISIPTGGAMLTKDGGTIYAISAKSRLIMQHHDIIESEGHNGRPTAQHVPSVETTPLLGQVESHTLTERSLYYKELKDLFFNSCTVTGGYLLQQSLQISSIFIVGRLGPLELSVAAFSYMIASTTGWLLAIGGTTAIDSLGSASIGRGDHVGEIGVLLQKYLISVTMMFIPVALLWTYSAAILLGFHVEPDIAYGTQTFLRTLLPFALGYILFEALKKFLQCQSIRAPGSIILLITAIINVPLNYLLVHVFKWGIIGGAIATGSMYWLSALLAVAYICFVDGSAGWQGWSRASLQDLGQFSRTVLFGILSIGAEWWAFETISIAAGTMGNIEAAVQSVIMTTDTVMALFPFGLGIATTNRVATLLGAGQLQRAKTVSRIASALAALNGCIVTIILLVFPSQITKFYTVDPDVLKVARVVFPWAAAFQVSDGLQCVNGGTLRALDRAGFAALINLVTYYALALPLCFTLAFIASLGLSGLWAGLALALTLCGGVEFLIVNVMDWKRLGFDEAKTEADDD